MMVQLAETHAPLGLAQRSIQRTRCTRFDSFQAIDLPRWLEDITMTTPDNADDKSKWVRGQGGLEPMFVARRFVEVVVTAGMLVGLLVASGGGERERRRRMPATLAGRV